MTTAAMVREDPDLVALRDARPGVDADDRLRTLLVSRLKPVVTAVVSRHMRDERDRQEADDLCHDVLLQLLTRLQHVRAGESGEPIADLGAYAAVTADRACSAHLRRKFPERSRLKNRVRYVLARGEGFRQTDGAGGLVCSLAEWPTAGVGRSGSERLSLLRTGTTASASFALGGHAPASLALPDLMSRVLRFAGAPVELDELVSALAVLLGVTDVPQTPTGPSDEEGGTAWWELLVDREKPLPDRLHDRAYLQEVWQEACELPPRQRAALLLNLRDAEGREMTSLFPLVGVATDREIAACLELSSGELAELWPRLPLDDLSIAGRLGITRQQVINLRKSARDRLARRLRRWRTES